jgi:hypothetical protein
MSDFFDHDDTSRVFDPRRKADRCDLPGLLHLDEEELRGSWQVSFAMSHASANL